MYSAALIGLCWASSETWRRRPSPGMMGAAVYIPTVFVPPLLITHVMAFRVLLSATGAGDAAR
jgi:hypothetical protein